MGRLLEVAVRDALRAPMQVSDSGTMTAEGGLDGDYRGTMKGRQVTLMSKEAWEETCADLGETLPWTTRRANLLVEGVDLAKSTGATIQVGDVVLEVNGETVPCGRMKEARPGLELALESGWRGGVFCTVVKGGAVRVGDEVAVKESVPVEFNLRPFRIDRASGSLPRGFVVSGTDGAACVS
jgi:MOSC domain-containing protein YiiM